MTKRSLTLLEANLLKDIVEDDETLFDKVLISRSGEGYACVPIMDIAPSVTRIFFVMDPDDAMQAIQDAEVLIEELAI